MSVLEGGMKCLKYTTFFFNFIVFIAGLFLAGFGGYLLLLLTQFHERARQGDLIVAPEHIKGFPIAIIVLGIIIFFVGFLGCCGACYESPCLLITFAATVAILLCLQIAVAIFAIMYKDEMIDFASAILNAIFNNSDTHMKRLIENEFGCCGFKMPDASCGFNIIRPNCWNAINGKIQSSMTAIIGTATGLCLLQVAAIVVACCLQSKIRSYVQC